MVHQNPTARTPDHDYKLGKIDPVAQSNAANASAGPVALTKRTASLSSVNRRSSSRMFSRRTLCNLALACCSAFLFFLATPTYAQNAAPAAPAAAPRGKPPVMKSIFWNTVMGSAWGAIIGGANALSDPSVNFRESMIFGTTFGGMFGYGFGVYLVIRGLSFDRNVIPEGITQPLTYGPQSNQSSQGNLATLDGSGLGGQRLNYGVISELSPEAITTMRDIHTPPFRLKMNEVDGEKSMGFEATVYRFSF